MPLAMNGGLLSRVAAMEVAFSNTGPTGSSGPMGSTGATGPSSTQLGNIVAMEVGRVLFPNVLTNVTQDARGSAIKAGSVDISFTPGRFTAPPVVFAAQCDPGNTQGHGTMSSVVGLSVTTSGATLTRFDHANSSNVSAAWLAVQFV